MNAVANRWHDREIPVLRAIAQAMDTTPKARVGAAELGQMLPALTRDDIQIACRNLAQADYIKIASSTRDPFVHCNAITERGLREAGTWPDPEAMADRLLWFLSQRVEAASTPEEKSRWERIRGSIQDAGREFAVEVAAAMATRTLGA